MKISDFVKQKGNMGFFQSVIVSDKMIKLICKKKIFHTFNLDGKKSYPVLNGFKRCCEQILHICITFLKWMGTIFVKLYFTLFVL